MGKQEGQWEVGVGLFHSLHVILSLTSHTHTEPHALLLAVFCFFSFEGMNPRNQRRLENSLILFKQNNE